MYQDLEFISHGILRLFVPREDSFIFKLVGKSYFPYFSSWDVLEMFEEVVYWENPYLPLPKEISIERIPLINIELTDLESEYFNYYIVIKRGTDPILKIHEWKVDEGYVLLDIELLIEDHFVKYYRKCKKSNFVTITSKPEPLSKPFKFIKLPLKKLINSDYIFKNLK